VLLDRRGERRVLDELIQAVRAGESRALVITGEPGIGKTMLLDYAAERATGCRVERVAAVESEMEIPWAVVHQLSGPVIDRLDALPAPQRDAVSGAFGLSDAPAADFFLVGLGVLGLLAHAAEEQPLICLVDDQQWLDFASARVLSFVARRLGWESLAVIFATRVTGNHLTGLPELKVGGLPSADVGLLLESTLPGKLDTRVRDRIVAETGGNPLALVELTRGMTPEQLAYGLELPGAVPLAGTIEDRFAQRVEALPEETRRLLTLAAADPVGDPLLLWQAAALIGIDADAQEPAFQDELAEFAPRVMFRHPLVRAAAYRSALPKWRQQSHWALAEVTDPELDTERRAWHRSQSVHGPDEEAAAELETGADLAKARGCLAAAGAYLQRAVALSLDPARRTDRAIIAAEGKIRAGAFDTGTELLAIAESGSLTDAQRARIGFVRAQLAYVSNRGGEAPALLQAAAKTLESVDTELARESYLDTMSAAIFAGRLAVPGGSSTDVARAALALSPTGPSPPLTERLLHAVAASYLQDEAEAIPALREALATFPKGLTADRELRWIWLICMISMRTLDHQRWADCAARHLRLARDAGALTELPLALNSQTYTVVFAGNLAAAGDLVAETAAVQTAVGSNLAPYGALVHAAMRGDARVTDELVKRTIAESTERGEGIGITMAEWADSLLSNGLGDYDRALAAAKRATEYEPDLRMLNWPVIELIEAAARSGDPGTASKAYRYLSTTTTASGTSWALGIQARSHALTVEGDEAEGSHRDAIEHLGATNQKPDLARAHLLYGEWLRRTRRRSESRGQLNLAQRMFETMGIRGFAARAERELRTTGQTPRKQASRPEPSALTSQEAQVARLARDGFTNPEIGTRLFISPHTVQYHLRKVFAKLGITSRAQLDRALAPEPNR
jgi:DNA-binding CsgD family transcriptional regulator/tetratricopeptide (TPR) repeat protein